MENNNLIEQAFSGLQVTNTENAEAVAEMLEQFGLRWSVSKQELRLPTGEHTGFYGIVRDDTRTTFATCKEGYTPYQNSELGELLLRIAEKTGYTIHSGGQFNGGGKVYLQLNTGTEIKGLGKNGTTVKGYVTGLNSHDGTTSLKWGAVNFTVCCKNTFAAAMKQLGQSARHTRSLHDKVEESIRQIIGITEMEKNIFDKFIKLSEVPVQKQHIAKIVKDITTVDIMSVSNEVSTYAKNRAEELTQSIATEMNQKGQTLWGLFSGVTHYTSHVMPAPSRTNGRLESKYTGTGLDIDNEAFASILEFAKLN